MSRGCWIAIVVVAGCGPAAKEPAFEVRESVEQLHVTHAVEGTVLEVHDAKDKLVASGTVDALGSLMFRNLPAGPGYVVRAAGAKEQTRPLTVMSVASSRPHPLSYGAQKLQVGSNYLRMRDGTTLSAWVTIPGSPNRAWPTIVVYSGYSASKPGKPSADLEFLCADLPIVCTPPDDGSALIAGMFGYATVSVNMRGTGCSGGAYDYFETMQVLDGYDVIEIVAAQSWVMHHQVGMVGLSYPGITQLFVGSTRPPGLAAIAPMSVIGNTSSTLLPGGILNDGFALSWVKNVLSKAVPYGQGWEQARVDEGDEECKENQLLHGQLVDNVAQARATEFYDPALHDRYNPTSFADQIEVPVFLTGAWQDEQTGPYFFTLFDRFSSSRAVRLNALNGVHIDGFAPQLVAEWHAFLELFVARRVPLDPTRVRNFSSFIFDQAFGSPQSLPSTRWYAFESYEEALAAWKAEPPIRLIMESGAGDSNDLGAPVGTFEHRLAQWPPPTQPTRLFFQPGGTLGSQPPTAADAASTFRLDPTAGARGMLAAGGDVWDKLPAWNWQQPEAGDAVVVESEPLTADLALIGTASVDLWLKSPVEDADLQVTLSELRPEGKETFIQAGWMRAGHRKPGPAANALWPDQTYEQKNWAPLPLNEWTQVRVPTAGFAHVLRAGSRVRIAVDTPGGTRADWRFALKKFPTEVRYAIGHDLAHPSSVVLPRVENVAAPAARPPCPSLRGQPCRAHVPYVNVAQ